MKVLAAILAVVMAGLSLTGCGSDAGGSSSSSGGQAQTESASQGEGGAGSEDAGQESAEVEEIVFAYMTMNNIPEADQLQRIEDLLNEYTVEQINTKVSLRMISIADYMSQVNLMLDSGEQLDIFRAQDTSHLPYILDGTALDITEYMDTILKDAADSIYPKTISQTTYQGRVYGMKDNGAHYVPGGFAYRVDIAEEQGMADAKEY